MKSNLKISQFSGFLLRSKYAIQVKICKWLKLFNSVSFIKNTHVNQVDFRIPSFWLTFTVLQWIKTNLQNQSIWRFLPRPGYALLVKIWQWLKLLKSNPFIKKTLVNQLYIRISSFWLIFIVLKWLKTN